MFAAEALRHPAAAGAFVPNDIQLGGGQAPLILLTGARRGGRGAAPRAAGRGVLTAGAHAQAPTWEASPRCCARCAAAGVALRAVRARCQTCSPGG